LICTRGGKSVARLCGLTGAFVAVLLLAGCGTAGLGLETPIPPSGIRGTVILGPTCATGQEPGAHEPVPCLTPYAAQLVVLDADNVVVTRTTSDAEGRFEVSLPPGDYVVTPQGGDPYPIAQPISVAVTPGAYVEVQVNFDTGIR